MLVQGILSVYICLLTKSYRRYLSNINQNNMTNDNTVLDELLSRGFSETLELKNFTTFKGTFILDFYLPIADSIENFEVYDDDTWVCSFPKSGTTWLQEMVWNINNNLDFDKASKIHIGQRFPYLEFSALCSEKRNAIDDPNKILNSVELAQNMPRPRFIKTHLPFHLLPRQLRTNEKKAKILYVARNPKDVCISNYHHVKTFDSYSGTLSEFCKLFLNDKALFAPYWKHVADFWDKRNDENILYLKFEDMKANLRSVITKVANFLGKNLNDDQLTKLENHLSFASMSANPSVNRETTIKALTKARPNSSSHAEGKFMRKGEINQWKSDMSEEIIQQFDEWINENSKNYESLMQEFL